MGVVGSVVESLKRFGWRLGFGRRTGLERPAIEGDSPVFETKGASWTDTRVLRDPGKPVGICVDHHVRLNMS